MLIPAAINALQHGVSEIKAVLNNGLRTMVLDQKSELAAVKAGIQRIRDTLTGHACGLLRFCWRRFLGRSFWFGGFFRFGLFSGRPD